LGQYQPEAEGRQTMPRTHDPTTKTHGFLHSTSGQIADDDYVDGNTIDFTTGKAVGDQVEQRGTGKAFSMI